MNSSLIRNVLLGFSITISGGLYGGSCPCQCTSSECVIKGIEEQRVNSSYFLICDMRTIYENIIRTTLPNIDMTRGQEGRKNTATVLQGLALSCSHFGQVINAQTPQEKQQGVLNVLGTALAVAAQIVAQNEKTNQQETTKQGHDISDGVVRSLHELTMTLVATSQDPEFRNPSFELPTSLREVAEGKTTEEQQSRLRKILVSCQQAQDYVTDLLTTIHTFLIEKFDDLNSLIKLYISDKIADWYYAQSAKEDQKNDIDQKNVPYPQRTPLPTIVNRYNTLRDNVDELGFFILFNGATTVFTTKEIDYTFYDISDSKDWKKEDIIKVAFLVDLALFEKLFQEECSKAVAL